MFSSKLIMTILALAAGTTADMWAGFENLPDGLYSGTINTDGSTEVTAYGADGSVAGTHHFDLVSETPESKLARRGLDKRDAQCWGYDLNHGGVDTGIRELRELINNAGGSYLIPRHDYIGFNNQGVYAYICNNDGNGWPQSFDNAFIDEATYAMDHKCKPYEAGWYFQPSNVWKVFGKCASGADVCKA